MAFYSRRTAIRACPGTARAIALEPRGLGDCCSASRLSLASLAHRFHGFTYPFSDAASGRRPVLRRGSCSSTLCHALGDRGRSAPVRVRSRYDYAGGPSRWIGCAPTASTSGSYPALIRDPAAGSNSSRRFICTAGPVRVYASRCRSGAAELVLPLVSELPDPQLCDQPLPRRLRHRTL